MKLYHATPIENKEDIEFFGLTANRSEKESNDIRLGGEYVFGFDNIDDARRFITDNTSEYVIFSFYASDSACINDTEYDEGTAWAVEFDIKASELDVEEVVE